MKYALIGCGRVAPDHIKAAVKNGLEIIAVCDINSDNIDIMFERAELSKEQREKIGRYSDYTKLFIKEQPELISIALPSGLHAECAKEAIKRKINVIIEKPIALSIKDADEIIELTEKYGVKVSACHQNRFNLAVQEMRAYLENGSFGRLSNAAVTMRWHRDESYYSAASWRGTWLLDGGALMNQSIHAIDLLRWMCGNNIKSVYGKTANVFHPYIEAEDIGAAVIEFENGCIATLEGTVNVPGENLEEHLTLIGETGIMKLGGKSANTVEFKYFFSEGSAEANSLVEKTGNVYGNGHTSLFADVIDAINTDREPYVSVYDGKRALETVLAVYLSSKTGEKVALPLKDIGTAFFKGQFGG
ncbi:MAG: Gfo/Idh/MocA family oxidoreductase [Oscillospiraceae bacterium]|nr:Gfo/Idh/MocA family oxidoreductase [Oscillospiraceae bacterium]